MRRGHRRLFVAVVLILFFAGAAFAEMPPLIPREILFGNPEKASPRISPDGTQLAYLSPSDKGVLNVWVRTIGRADDTQVTNDTHRGIRIHFWAEDGKHLLYMQDLNGDENFHVYSVDLDAKVVRDLTPFQGIRAQGVITDKHFPNEMLVGLNLRDRRVFDMYRVDLTTGAIAIDTQNPGDVVGWQTDPGFQIRAATAMSLKDGSKTLRVRDGRDTAWRDLITWPFGENGGADDFTADGKELYIETSLGSDTTRLVKVGLTSGKEIETIATDPKVDVGEVVIHPDTHTVQAVGFTRTKNEWRVLDPEVKSDFEVLAKLGHGEFYLTGRDRADKNWIVTYQTDDGPVAYYAYSREAKKAELLFVNRPKLAGFTLAKMEPVIIKSRDGLELVSYLTLPVGVATKNLPLVLNVHGGPWGRDSWGYDGEAQWLANRGYACLQVNFRASTGFGKKFLNEGNLQWGAKMQDDLTDAVKWAIGKGIADPKKICIYGGSYGGYATLAGLVFTPDLYTCGVDIVGPSNLATLLASIPPYWGPAKKEFTLRMGDVEKDPVFNQKISPLFHVQNIRAPLIIAQGANDPRVNIKESTQMVEAMRARNLPVTYVVYTDEGHGFARPENRLDFYGRADEFLAKYLGGRSEPWKEVKGASVEVR
ncbi:MAG TPA: S9 family peptidase [Thermoanaerobaculaceae bacterium]|nr:S9 family peptidase [Thermoanaerobaculaceae bacterium]